MRIKRFRKSANRLKNILICICIIFLLSCSSAKDKKRVIIVEKLKPNDIALSSPQPGEWLYAHPEKGQTFRAYKSCSRVVPSADRNIIYLQPIGNFDSLQWRVIQYTEEYLSVFFCLKTRVMPVIGNETISKKATRIGPEGNEQILASFIIDSVLKKRIPTDAIVVMAISEKDLYPKPSWNYVFGLATYKERVGVTSLYRFSDYGMTTTNYRLCLQRLIKTSSHEIGHMFSMHHCTYAVCNMNGSNSLHELDTNATRLCSECTGKLMWNLQFNLPDRLQKLSLFFKKHHLDEDYERINADIGLLKAN